MINLHLTKIMKLFDLENLELHGNAPCSRGLAFGLGLGLLVGFVKLCSSFPLKFYSCIPEFFTYYSFTVSLLFSKNAHHSSY